MQKNTFETYIQPVDGVHAYKFDDTLESLDDAIALATSTANTYKNSQMTHNAKRYIEKLLHNLPEITKRVMVAAENSYRRDTIQPAINLLETYATTKYRIVL